MKKIYISLSCFAAIIFSLHSMHKEKMINIEHATDRPVHLNTLREYKNYFQKDIKPIVKDKLTKREKKGKNTTIKLGKVINENNVTISDDLMASLAEICLFKNENQAPQKTWVNRLFGTGIDTKEIIQKIKKENPESYGNLKNYVLVQGLKHNGDVHAKIRKYQTSTRTRKTSTTTTTDEKEAIAKKIQVDVNNLGYSPGKLTMDILGVLRGEKDARIKWGNVVGATITIAGFVATVLGIYFALNSCEECEECPTGPLGPTAPFI